MKQTLTRLISLLLILALLLSISACHEPAQPTVTTTPSQQETTVVPTTTPTEPTIVTDPTVPTTVPAEPTEPTEPTEPLPEGELTYVLTQEDVDAFYKLLSECETLAIAGEDMDAIETISNELDDMYMYLEEQNSIATILYYSDMSDAALTKQYLDNVDITTAASDQYIQSARRIYLSDTPAKDMLFEGWTEEDFEMLLNYDEKVSKIQQRNAEIAVDYRAATDDSVRIPLYIEFIQNNNAIAQVYGYDNYYTYAYEVVYDRDYDHESIQQMRQYAQTYLTQAFEESLQNFNRSYGSLNTRNQQNLIEFLYNDYDSLKVDYVGKYMETMPESMRKHFDRMIASDSLFATADGAMPGAFTTMVGKRSYCFFGPGYANSTTIIHEAGHYYASRYADLNSIPLDLAETHSQGNEWLFIASLSDDMNQYVYNALVDYLMYEDLVTIIICLMVDEFEQQVYSVDVSDFTAEDFDAIMNSVCQQYFDLDYAAHNFADVNGYWRMVVIEQPVYYISYAVSATAAVDLYSVALKDYAAATEIYRKLCEEPVLEEGFVSNIAAAGLSGPFQEEFYKGYLAMIKARGK